MLDNFLIKLFHEGKCLEAYKVFGAHPENNKGKKGMRFTVYAPNARSVQVIGDFNKWDGKDHYMERYTDGGIWTLFIADVDELEIYKYRIETPHGNTVDRADPYAFFSEFRPGTASKTYDLEGYKWGDGNWMRDRTKNFDRQLNIYEMNLGSWKLKKE
ncbi:MAG: GlgB N-terminal domain-containing protein, partial [bacterium]